MKKILLLAQLPPPIHGVTVVTQEVHRHVIATPGYATTHLWQGGASGLLDVGVIGLSKVLELGALIGKLGWWSLTRKRFDIAYLTLAPWARAALRDGLLAAMAKCVADRTLVHVHGEGLDAIIAGRTLRDRLIRRMLAGCELIAITSDTQSRAENSGLFNHVWQVSNFVAEPAVISKPVASGALRFGFLGNLDAMKGVVRLVHVIAALRRAGIDATAEIAGPETARLSFERLGEIIAESGAGEHIKVIGPKFGEDKASFLAGLDVFLYLTKHDHAPLVVIEAMSYGVIPIVSDHGGVPELLGPELSRNVVATKVPEAQLNAAVLAIVRGYADAANRATASAAARERYTENYTRRHFAAALDEVLRGQ